MVGLFILLLDVSSVLLLYIREVQIVVEDQSHLHFHLQVKVSTALNTSRFGHCCSSHRHMVPLFPRAAQRAFRHRVAGAVTARLMTASARNAACLVG